MLPLLAELGLLLKIRRRMRFVTGAALKEKIANSSMCFTSTEI
jgi:hypothetical protein